MTVLKFDGEHDFLSNFYEAPVTYASMVFPTNEHAFQAAKGFAWKDHDDVASANEYMRAVRDAPTPSKAKYLGRSVHIDLDFWEAEKVNIMRKICFNKFAGNLDLATKLLKTEGMLVEGNTWGDTFWGRVDGKGLNMLGCILMEVRGHLLWKDYHG